MKAPRILLSLLFSDLLLQAHALIPTDRKQRLTEHWEFIRQDMGSIWEVMRPITGAGKPETVPLWQKVTLPHCFNAEDAVDPDVNYYQVRLVSHHAQHRESLYQRTYLPGV